MLYFEDSSSFRKRKKIGYTSQYRRKYRNYLETLSNIIVKTKNKKAKSLVKVTWDSLNREKSNGYCTFKLNDNLLSGKTFKIAQAFLSYDLKNNTSEKLFAVYILQQKQNNTSILKIKTGEIMGLIKTTGKLRLTKASTVNRVEWLLNKLKNDGLIHNWAYSEIYKVAEIKQNAGWINRWLDHHVLIDISEEGLDAGDIINKTITLVNEQNMMIKDFAQKANLSKITASKVLRTDSIDNSSIVLKLADFLVREGFISLSFSPNNKMPNG